MIVRPFLKTSPNPPSDHTADPWESCTSAWSTDDEWAQDLSMPDFSLMSDDQIEKLLPQPLKDQFRLSQGFVQLIELARRIPADLLLSMTETIRKGAERVNDFNRDFSESIALLASAIEDCHREDPVQLNRFHRLKEQFEAFSDQNRELLLATVQEVCEACEPLAK